MEHEQERDNSKDGEDHTQSSEADECNNMELLPEGDNLQLLRSLVFLGRTLLPH